jgi:hypothetical protein
MARLIYREWFVYYKYPGHENDRWWNRERSWGGAGGVGGYAIEDLRPLMEKIGSTGATMTNVSKGKFKALEVIWPGDKMIDLYHENVASMFDQIKALQKQNIKLKATRDLLLPRLISGKIKFQGEPSHDFKKN